MATPISGDKLIPNVDVKMAQAEKRKQETVSQNEPSRSSNKTSADSLQINHGQAQTEARPLSDTLSNGEQAQNALQTLLNRIQNNPEQALQAQGQVPQFQADALMSVSAT